MTAPNWLDTKLFGVREIQDGGAALPERAKLNFLGAGVTVVDNQDNESIDVTIDTPEPASPLFWDPVDVVATTNVNLAGTVASADSVSLSTGMRVGLVSQTAGAQNGIYRRNAGGFLVRADDADTADEFRTGMTFSVKAGATYIGKTFSLVTATPITLETTSLKFLQPSASLDARVIATANGIANDAAAITAALVASSVVRLTAGTYLIDSNVTYSGTGKRIVVEPGASVTLGAGRTVTINLEVEAGRAQWLTGTGVAVFGVAGPEAAKPEWWGGLPDGVIDTGPAMRKAVDAQRTRNFGALDLDRGDYKITTSGTSGGSTGGIIADVDDFHIRGAGPGETRILMDHVSIVASFIPIFIQRWGVDDLEPQEILRGSVRDLRVEWVLYGPPSAAAICVMNCNGHVIEDVEVVGDGTGMGLSITDGVAYAWGSRDCTFDRLLIEGISKSGLYLSGAVGCRGQAIVRNCFKHASAQPGGAAGVQLSSASDCDLDVETYGHNGMGLIMNVNGTDAAVIANLSNQTHFDVNLGTPRSAYFISSLAVLNTTDGRAEKLDIASYTDTGDHQTWNIVLNAAPSQTLSNGMAVYDAYRPCENTTIRGRSYDNDVDGVVIGAAVDGGYHRGILFDGFHCYRNTSNGIVAIAVDGLTLNGCIFHHNQSGATFADTSPAANVKQVTRNVQIVGGCQFFENTNADIAIRSIKGIKISADTIILPESSPVLMLSPNYRACVIDAGADTVTLASHFFVVDQPVLFSGSALPAELTAGVPVYVIASGLTSSVFKVSATQGGAAINFSGTGTSVTVATGVRTTDMIVGAYLAPGFTGQRVGFQTNIGDLAVDGHFDLDLPASTPDALQYAPMGSRAWNRATGFHYIKGTVGTSASGWLRIFTTDDAATAATASKLVMRDGSGGATVAALQASAINDSGLTASQAVVTDGSKNLASLAYDEAATASTIVKRTSNGAVAGTYLTLTLSLLNTAGGFNLEAGGSGTIAINRFGGAIWWTFGASSTQTSIGPLTWTKDASPTFSIATPTADDTDSKDITFQSHAPYASATGSHRDAGDVVFNIAAAISGGVDGLYLVKFNGTTRIKVGGVGMALFGGTERAQPARAGQLTDNSGGTSGGNTIAVIGGAVDPTAASKADTANAIATIAAKVNAIEDKMSAAGTGIGVTA